MLTLFNPLLLLLLWTPNVIRLPSLEGGDEGGYVSVWGGVRLVMGVIIFGTPIKSRIVHDFQDICIFVKKFEI
jgi:hypothetical protein